MSKRTLALRICLLIVLVCMAAVITTDRPIVIPAAFVALIAVWALTQWMLLFWPVSDEERAALQDWAESHGCILLRFAHSPLHDRVARERHAANGYLYFVRVRDSDGDERTAWVRLKCRDAEVKVVRYRWEDAG